MIRRRCLVVLLIAVSVLSCEKSEVSTRAPVQTKKTREVTYRCARGMHAVNEDAQCCFHGQKFNGRSCSGDPICPEGMYVNHGTCLWDLDDAQHNPRDGFTSGDRQDVFSVERIQDEHDLVQVDVPDSSFFLEALSKLDLASMPQGIRFDSLRTRNERILHQVNHHAYDPYYDFIWDTSWIGSVDTLYLIDCTQIHPEKLTSFLRSANVSTLVLEHNQGVRCLDRLFSVWSQQDDLGQLESLKVEGDLADTPLLSL